MKLKYCVIYLFLVTWLNEAESIKIGNKLKLKRKNDRQASNSTNVLESSFSAFLQYERKYNKTTSTFGLLSRYRNFQQAIQFITNYKNENHTFEMGLNDLSDRSPQEHGLLLGIRVPATKEGVQENGTEWYFKQAPTPDSLDYRTSPYLGPVKNQMSCGGCWAFVANTPIEYQEGLKKAQNTSLSLSEQQLIDCSGTFYGTYGCRGGFYTGAWDYVKSAPGITSAASYPYRSANGWFCFYNPTTSVATVSGWQWAPTDEILLRTTLFNKGPLAAAIHVVRSLYHYRSGIYNDLTCSSNPRSANHAVVIVGYGNNASNGVNFWIIRNSWGPRWGINGYFLLSFGVNRCGIANWVAYPNVS